MRSDWINGAPPPPPLVWWHGIVNENTQKVSIQQLPLSSNPNQEVPLPGKEGKAVSAVWSPRPGDHRHSPLENKGSGRTALSVNRVSRAAPSAHTADETEHTARRRHPGVPAWCVRERSAPLSKLLTRAKLESSHLLAIKSEEKGHNHLMMEQNRTRTEWDAREPLGRTWQDR